jgi:hypothetical protein
VQIELPSGEKVTVRTESERQVSYNNEDVFAAVATVTLTLGNGNEITTRTDKPDVFTESGPTRRRK